MRIAEGMGNLERGIPLLCFRLAKGKAWPLAAFVPLAMNKEREEVATKKRQLFAQRGSQKLVKKAGSANEEVPNWEQHWAGQYWRLLAEKKKNKQEKQPKSLFLELN